jgi:hypothetical protein
MAESILLKMIICIIFLCMVIPSLAISRDIVAYDIGDLLVKPEGEYYTQLIPQSNGGLSVSNSNMSSVQSLAYFGWNPNTVGAAVKFSPPNKDWDLRKVQVVGWNIFDPKNETHPEEKFFVLEVRDSNLNLLYKLVDSRLTYFQSGEPSMATIEIPAISMNDDFYVVFYDRGGVGIGTNITKAQETSYFYNGLAEQMLPAQVTLSNETASLNWIIRAVGG